jgi:hypothetical protein
MRITHASVVTKRMKEKRSVYENHVKTKTRQSFLSHQARAWFKNYNYARRIRFGSGVVTEGVQL